MSGAGGFAFGLGCDCCEPDSCRVRLNVIMSDNQPFDASGVTFTVVIKQGSTTIETIGPLSPSLPAYQANVELSASTTYTATLTVEQVDGSTCTFPVREFTTPALCNPFPVNLFIPRVWVAFGVCNDCAYLAPWGMPVSVSGPDGFAASGTTTEYPDPPPVFLSEVPPLRYAFTPCSEGDYVVTGTTAVPNTTAPTATIAVDFVSGGGWFPAIDHTGTEYQYWQKRDAQPSDIKPVPGYVWPGTCAEPVPSTLYMTGGGPFGSCTLTATGDGECGGVWTGTSTGTLPTCDGSGTGMYTINWVFRPTQYYSQVPWQTEHFWEISGTVMGVCDCIVAGVYGQCTRVIRSGTGAGIAGGSVLRAIVPGVTPYCPDCSALDVSFDAYVCTGDPVYGPAGTPCEQDDVDCWAPIVPPAGCEYGTITVTI